MNQSSREFVLAGGALGLVLLLLNPGNWYMPSMLVEGLVVSLYILFALFVIFVWQEKANDEREEALQMRVGRLSYLATASILVIGIGVEALQEHMNVWLVLGLFAAVIAKTLGKYFYKDRF